MAVTNYYSFGGEIIGEETGGVRRDYLTDALGSVTATVTSASAVENTYRYKPYGDTLAKTGTGSDPKFLWNGKWGYFETRKNYPDLYVRSRYYSSKTGIWTTVDPKWPNEPPYKYVNNNPLRYKDQYGLSIDDLKNFPDDLLREICKNIAICGYRRHQLDLIDFYHSVRKGGPWDYKGRCGDNLHWQNFGNINYGAAGIACGFSRMRLLNEAGCGQIRDGSSPSLGRPGTMIGLKGGIWPFGDDPHDSNMIDKGIRIYWDLERSGFKKCKELDRSWPNISYSWPKRPHMDNGDSPPFEIIHGCLGINEPGITPSPIAGPWIFKY